MAAVISTGAFAASSSGVLITPDATELNSREGAVRKPLLKAPAPTSMRERPRHLDGRRDYGENAKVEGVKSSYVQNRLRAVPALAINALILEGRHHLGPRRRPGQDAETSAVGGSALAAVYSKSEGNANALRVRVKGTDFTGNASTGQGGAVYLEGVGTAFTDSNFQNNTSSEGRRCDLREGRSGDPRRGERRRRHLREQGRFRRMPAASSTPPTPRTSPWTPPKAAITIGTAGESTDGLASTRPASHGTLRRQVRGKVVINSSMESWNNDITHSCPN